MLITTLCDWFAFSASASDFYIPVFHIIISEGVVESWSRQRNQNAVFEEKAVFPSQGLIQCGLTMKNYLGFLNLQFLNC